MTSPLLLIASLFTGIFYAYFLYTKKAPWNQQTNIFLALLRIILVFIIVFLILSPFISRKISHTENPIIVFAIDNSKSIILNQGVKKIRSQLHSLQKVIKDMNEKEVKIQIVALDKSIDVDSLEDIKFNQNKTDLNGFLTDIQNNSENTNINAVVLLTDGIINSGSFPAYSQYQFNIHTIGVGDTVARKDILLKSTQYNNIVSAGNKFPIVVEVKNTGYKGESSTIRIRKGKNVLYEKQVYFKSYEEVTAVEFTASEDKPGLEHYIAEIVPLKDEFSTKNNASHLYFNVVEAKQKILIIAAVPHPDIKALKSVGDKNDNIEMYVHIPGINELKDEKYDLVIFHQVPNIYGIGSAVLSRFSKDQIPLFFITGSISNINEQNIMTRGLRIMAAPGQYDKVTPDYNSSFSRFVLDAMKTDILVNSPPFNVPFGEYSLSADWETVFYQKVGAYITTKPLIALNLAAKPSLGILAGEGLWQWRLNEFENRNETGAFDDLFNKLFQLLAKKEDKTKLRVTPVQRDFVENEKVVLQVETYNDIYEKTFGNKINMTISHESGKKYKYSFINDPNNPDFEISGLPQGLYTYQAEAQLGTKNEIVKSEFSVMSIDLEELETKADFNLLRQLSLKNNGTFYNSDHFDSLAVNLLSNKPKGLIYNSDNLTEVINIRWLLAVFVLLAGFEWAMRKYLGSY